MPLPKVDDILSMMKFLILAGVNVFLPDSEQ